MVEVPELHSEVARIGTRLAAEIEELAAAPADHSPRDAQLLDAQLHRVLQRGLQGLEALQCVGRENQLPSSVLWKAAGAWLAQGPLQNHAREKPRGYAGDYLMLEKICRGEIAAGSPLAASFDRFFQLQAAPQAVRHRNQLVAGEIVTRRQRQPLDTRLHVVSVGSGPAYDVRSALAQLPPAHRGQVELTLIDMDDGALAFCDGQLQQFDGLGTLRTLRENLFRLPHKLARTLDLHRPQLIVCKGLLDYLQDDDAAALIAALRAQLDPAGALWVFQFSPINPSRGYMEWLGNWYLNYRLPHQLRGLAERAGIPPESYRVGAEVLGVDLLLEVASSGN